MIKSKKRVADNAAEKQEPAAKKPLIDNKNFNNKNKDKKRFTKSPSEPSFKKPDFKAKSNKFNKDVKGKPVKKTEPAPEKTDWVQFKKEKKELKMKRKKSKDIYEISLEAKQIFEKLRCRRTAKKAELVEKLYHLCISGEDTLKKMVMAHDTARVIQCMLKFASPELSKQISEKLLPLAVEMSISKYSHFCVLRIFKYGSTTAKSKLVDSFLGSVIKLASHNISSKILDHVYLDVANAQQKAFMRQEFYGDLYKKSKDKNVKCLTDTYKDSPGLKSSILGAVKLNLEHVINKKLVDNSLVHAVMLEYIGEVEDDKVEEAVTLFGTVIPLMLTTKDGCQAAIISFYKSTAKNRRAIIKAIKEHLVKICTHEQGHVFILAVLNSLDDTKATKKAIFDNIHPELKTLMSNQFGRRVIEWLVNPADTNSFHPGFIANLDEGLQYGKKDKDLRRKEIFEQIEAPIATAITEQPEFWLSDAHIGLVTAEILKKVAPTNFVQLANVLAGVIVDPKWTVDVEKEQEKKQKTAKKPVDIEKIIAKAMLEKKKKQKKAKNSENNEGEAVEEGDHEVGEGEVKNTIAVPGIEDAGLHIVLKKIIKSDKDRVDRETFGSILVQHLTDETLDYWLTVNRGCFVLLNIVENNNETVGKAMKKRLNPKLSLLEQQSGIGAQLLLKRLAQK